MFLIRQTIIIVGLNTSKYLSKVSYLRNTFEKASTLALSSNTRSKILNSLKLQLQPAVVVVQIPEPFRYSAVNIFPAPPLQMQDYIIIRVCLSVELQ